VNGTFYEAVKNGPILNFPMEFIHLNIHSHYSKGWGIPTLEEGIPTLEELCRAAQACRMKHLALTDTNGLYGAVFFIQEAMEAGLKPILGSELVHGENRAVLLVKNLHGYANLCRLVSDRHCDQEFDLIRALQEHREGLTILSDDERLLNTLKAKGGGGPVRRVVPGLSDGSLLRLFSKERDPACGDQPGLLPQEGRFPSSPDPQGRLP
jgi:hypothetical protein